MQVAQGVHPQYVVQHNEMLEWESVVEGWIAQMAK
jgi:hypothetical protein